jgi:hypothetical protein
MTGVESIDSLRMPPVSEKGSANSRAEAAGTGAFFKATTKNAVMRVGAKRQEQGNQASRRPRARSPLQQELYKVITRFALKAGWSEATIIKGFWPGT